MKIDELLPIGSVVLLKDSSHKLMVIGYYQKKLDAPNKVYDYAGCLFPEGYISAEQNLLFDHDKIDRVYAVGYMDDGQYDFIEKLNRAIVGYRQQAK